MTHQVTLLNCPKPFFKGLGHGGDKIRRKIRHAMVFTLCALFLSIPAVAATESKNTENTVFAKATTDQNLKIGMEGDNVIELQNG